jgi:hypothetical protein
MCALEIAKRVGQSSGTASHAAAIVCRIAIRRSSARTRACIYYV